MKNNEYARDWLRRAKSNLERARGGKIKEEIYMRIFALIANKQPKRHKGIPYRH